MIRALNTAATGMEAQQLRLDVIANNLANASTNGYKKSRADFQDQLYQTIRAPGTSAATGVELPVGIQIGQGVRPVATQRIFTVGELKQTNNQLDVAIEGGGFFQIRQPNGEPAFTRAGSFKLNSEGQMVTSNGFQLEPSINIPQEAVSVTIGTDGVVSVVQSGGTEGQELGQIQLAKFANPAGLQAIGRNLFVQTSASGSPVMGNPGDSGSALGTLAQGVVESSNVNVVEEMLEMIVSQRSFELNSKVISTADQILQASTSLR